MTAYIVGGVFAAVITAIAAIVVAGIARRTNRDANAITFANTLNNRLQAVEDDLEEVKNQLTRSQRAVAGAVRFIDRLVEWGRLGGKGQMPNPPKTLHEYLDADAWGLVAEPVDDHPNRTTN
jgi:hypothetical protein